MTAESIESAREHMRRWIDKCGVGWVAELYQRVYTTYPRNFHTYLLGTVLREVRK